MHIPFQEALSGHAVEALTQALQEAVQKFIALKDENFNKIPDWDEAKGAFKKIVDGVTEGINAGGFASFISAMTAAVALLHIPEAKAGFEKAIAGAHDLYSVLSPYIPKKVAEGAKPADEAAQA